MRGVLFFCLYRAWLGEGQGWDKCAPWLGSAARTLNQNTKNQNHQNTKYQNLKPLPLKPLSFNHHFCKNTFLFCKFLQKQFCKFYCTPVSFIAIFAALSTQNSIASSSILSLSLGNNHAKQHIKSFPILVLKSSFNISTCFSSTSNSSSFLL